MNACSRLVAPPSPTRTTSGGYPEVASCYVLGRSVAILTFLGYVLSGEEAVPLQADGEAWLQPPGIIKIEHKNRVQMLARDRVSS